MKRLLVVAALLFLPSLASAQGVGEVFEGVLLPQLVGGVSYDRNSTQEFQAVLSANILGPKILGNLYVSGVGVGLNTVVPGLQDQPIASWSFPLLTYVFFGDRVGVQLGFATPLQGGEKVPYLGVTVGVADTPVQAKAKRIRRIEAKKAKKALLLQDEARGRYAHELTTQPLGIVYTTCYENGAIKPECLTEVAASPVIEQP